MMTELIFFPFSIVMELSWNFFYIMAHCVREEKGNQLPIIN